MRSGQNSDLNLKYLQLQLARIDILLAREIHRWQLAGQNTGDTYRGLYISDNEADRLVNRPLGESWGQTVNLDPAEEKIYFEASRKAEDRIKEFAAQYEGVWPFSRFQQLSKVFQLDPVDQDILLLCLASSLDLKYERIYGYLQDDVTRKQPGINLVLNLFAPPGVDRFLLWPHLASGSPLIRNQILDKQTENSKVPLLKQTISVNETVINWLLGNYQPQTDISSFIHQIDPVVDQVDRLQAGQALHSISLERFSDPHFVFYGPDFGAQESAVRLVASQLKAALLAVNLPTLIRSGLNVQKALTVALRDGLLTNSIPWIAGWDAILTEDGTAPSELLELVCAYPHTVIISGTSEWHATGIERIQSFIWQKFPLPGYLLRLSLWRYWLKKFFPGSTITVDPIAGQFELSSIQIRDACLTARDAANKDGREISVGDFFLAARAHSNPRLSNLARKIVPRYDWNDIVLPDDQLAILGEIINTVKGRPKVLHEWGVGKKLAASSGVPILFSGPPGTGKTMAAEIIAGELNLDLYKIDLSTIVSKYIGETEKNMERIFSEAESSNAILFFDEADALFGKRSEVRDSHDRYANIEISYLLQRMEAYDGVTILATNLRANLDEAFTRRLQFSVSFPFPDEPDRLRIWKALFPSTLPMEPGIDFQLLAHRFKLPGGNIRNIIVNAAFLAAADGGRVAMGHLFHSIHREYQKLGRLVGEEDLVIEK